MNMATQKRDASRRWLLWAAVILSACLVSGCFPGQFPTPTPRTAPPAQTNGTGPQTPHHHGAPGPTWQDAAGG